MVQIQEVKERCISHAKYLDGLPSKQRSIPGMKGFIKLLRKDFKEGHLLHTELILSFLQSKNFMITHINKQNISTGDDVDIELNHNINIQVWYGQNLSNHMTNCLAHAKEKNIKIKGRVYKTKVHNGGIKTVCDEDSDIQKKIDQLPNKNLGLVICHDLGMFISPEFIEQLPENKAIVDISHTGLNSEFSKIVGHSELYCSKNFKFGGLTEEILSEIGFPINIIH